MFGWNGRLLRVDLTTGKISVEDVDPQLAKEFIGGRAWDQKGVPTQEKLVELGLA